MESGEAADRAVPQGAVQMRDAQAAQEPQPAQAQPQQGASASQSASYAHSFSAQAARDLEQARHAVSELKTTVAALLETVKSLEKTVSELRSESSGLKTELARLSERTGGLEEVKAEQAKARKHAKDMDKANDRIDLIMEEVGYGEEIDVAKIPPNILEVVFQSTLDDVVDQIWRDLGAHDAELIIQATLEEVRMRTSGSELFAFEGKRILTRNLGRTLEKDLISARQIQTTYKELLGRLLDHLPGYKPKNFRAMIKIKSQEYAVDKATSLSEKTAELDVRTAGAVAKLEAVAKRLEGIDADITARFEESIQRQKQEQARTFEKQRAFLEDTLTQYKKGIDEQMEDLRRDLGTSRRDDDQELENLRKTLGSKEEGEAAPDVGGPDAGETPSAEPVSEPSPAPELTETESAVLDAIGARGAKFDAMLKKLKKQKLGAEEAETALASLKEKGFITVKGRGKARKVARAKPAEPEGAVESAPEAGGKMDDRAGQEPPAEEAAPEEPKETLTLKSMTEEQRLVYDAIPKAGTTQKALAQELAEKVKYMDVLKTLRTLMDSGLVEVETRGRHAVFTRKEIDSNR